MPRPRAARASATRAPARPRARSRPRCTPAVCTMRRTVLPSMHEVLAELLRRLRSSSSARSRISAGPSRRGALSSPSAACRCAFTPVAARTGSSSHGAVDRSRVRRDLRGKLVEVGVETLGHRTAACAAPGRARSGGRGTASGVRYGASVSTRMRSRGDHPQRLAQVPGVLERDGAGEREVPAGVGDDAGELRVAARSSGTPCARARRRAAASRGRRRARRGRGSAGRVRARFAISMCASNERNCAPRPSSPVRKKSRPVSPMARTRGRAASSSISASASSRAPDASSSGASLGCSATAASRRGSRAATSADHRDVARSVPTCTTPRRRHWMPRGRGARARRAAARRRRSRGACGCRRRRRRAPRAAGGYSTARPPSERVRTASRRAPTGRVDRRCACAGASRRLTSMRGNSASSGETRAADAPTRSRGRCAARCTVPSAPSAVQSRCGRLRAARARAARRACRARGTPWRARSRAGPAGAGSFARAHGS